MEQRGVCRLLEVLGLGGGERFFYPCELALHSRLRQGHGEARSSADEARRRRLLEEARYFLEQARSRDPGYGPAYVNLSCAALLEGEYGEGVVWAERGMEVGRRLGEMAVVADGFLARGISSTLCLSKHRRAQEEGHPAYPSPPWCQARPR